MANLSSLEDSVIIRTKIDKWIAAGPLFHATREHKDQLLTPLEETMANEGDFSPVNSQLIVTSIFISLDKGEALTARHLTMSIIGFEARNETSFREGDSHTLRQIVQLVLPAVQTFVCEGDWPMVNFASRRSISFTAKDCRPNYFMLCKTFLCGARWTALHLRSICERDLFFVALASFTRE